MTPEMKALEKLAHTIYVIKDIESSKINNTPAYIANLFDGKVSEHIQGFPTMFGIVQNGSKWMKVEYRGQRVAKDMHKFMLDLIKKSKPTSSSKVVLKPMNSKKN
jgi:hypothetical protein